MSIRPKRVEATNLDRGVRAPVDEAALIVRVQRGDIEAFADLVRAYQDRIHNTCWRLCGHLDDARDLTQEAFLKAFENLHAFRGDSAFYTWIFRIAVNLALSHRRSSRRRGGASLDQLLSVKGTQAETLVHRMRDNEPLEPAHSASNAEMQGRAAHALHDLDEEFRAVVVLRDIEGFDYQEIADILGIPKGTVRSRLHRGRLALRDAIAAHEQKHGS
ncbi:MAG: sigma-70 family RNA polymerase sigma factor [Planctomycetes bacterium]|nr:sigma-70 family RNA polymerase sigma factor [Planctomycetota bacterium]